MPTCNADKLILSSWSTPAQACTAWAGVLANGLLVLWCAWWLLRHMQAGPSLPTLLLLLPVILFLADLFSGLVHWVTDTWFDEVQFERVISIAREHHLHPQHILGYGVRDYLAYSCWPSAICIAPVALVLTLVTDPAPAAYGAVLVCFAIATLMIVGTYAHRLGHKWSDWATVRWLQGRHLLMSPRHHWVHHHGAHDIRYCVINGWANHVCDYTGFWRALEHVIARVTGAVPRRNDCEWFAHFACNTDFLGPRRTQADCSGLPQDWGSSQLSRPRPTL